MISEEPTDTNRPDAREIGRAWGGPKNLPTRDPIRSWKSECAFRNGESVAAGVAAATKGAA